MKYLEEKRVGRYILGERLGGSGLATVYKSHDPERNHPVAVKVMRNFFASDTEAHARFREEMVLWQSLSHPGIARLYQWGIDEGVLWMAMEYFPKGSLKELLGKPMGKAEAMEVLTQLGRCLDAAHQGGMVHGDIKPSNIFLTEEGTVSLADFGMAALSHAAHPLVRSTLNTPAPAFAAPEQIQGFPPDQRWDVYAMGVLAHRLLTGRLPYEGLSAYTKLSLQRVHGLEPPSKYDPSLSGEVDTAFFKACATLPEGRFQRAGEMVEALVKAVGSPCGEAALGSWAEGGLVTAEGEASAAQVAVDERLDKERLICPVCSHGNLPNAEYCSACWARLQGAETVPLEKERALARRLRQALYRHRVLKWGILTAVILSFSVWASYQIWNLNPHPGLASTNLDSNSVAGEWAMLGRDVVRTGYNPDASPVEGTLAWKFDTSAPLLSSPAVAGGRVYLATGEKRIVALSALDGKLIWEQELSGPVDSSPAVAGDLVVLGLRDSRVIALDSNTGKLRWEYDTDNPVFGSPMVYQGVVYIGSGDGYVYGLDAGTGELRWKYRTETWIISSPAVKDGVVAFASADSKLYLASAHNGAKGLVFEVPRGTRGGPVIVGDRVLIGSGASGVGRNRGWLWAVDRKAKQITPERWVYKVWLRLWLWGMAPDPPPPRGLLWGFQVKGGLTGSPAVKEGTAFLGDREGWLYAVNVETGKGRWETRLQSPMSSSPAVMGDTIVVATDDGRVRALSVDGGKEMWSFATKGRVTASPAVANGFVYAVSNDGTLYALK